MLPEGFRTLVEAITAAKKVANESGEDIVVVINLLTEFPDFPYEFARHDMVDMLYPKHDLAALVKPDSNLNGSSNMVCKCVPVGESFGQEEKIRWGNPALRLEIGQVPDIGDVTLVVQKQVDWEDWVVCWYVDGVYSEEKSYHAGDDKKDAINTAHTQARELQTRI